MRRLLARISLAFGAAQGLLGVAAISAGAYLIAGLGWSLVTLGAALLFAAAVGA